MNDLLYELYMGNYDPTPDCGQEQAKVQKELFQVYKQIEACFDYRFVDHMSELRNQLEERTEYEYYCAGIRLGVRLMLAALTGVGG